VTQHVNGLMGQVVSAVRTIMDALAAGRGAEALAVFEDLKPLLADRATGSLLARLVSGPVAVARVAPGLYVGGSSVDRQALLTAHSFVAERLPVASGLVIVATADGGARSISEFPGMSIVLLGHDDLADSETMAHELVHARLRSGHRMLDEGIAEWLGTEARFGADGAMAELGRRAQGGPAPATLAARRWTDQPVFEGLDAPPRSAHAVAALTVAAYARRHGLSALISLAQKVEADAIEDIRELLIIDVPQCAKMPCDPAIDHDIATMRLKFRLGDQSEAEPALARYRRLHLDKPDDPALEDAYLMALILAANHPDATELRGELDVALERYVAGREDTSLAYALCVAREGLRIRYATDFIVMNESFERGRRIIEAALDEYESDIDVLVTAAKFEFYTPAEYGGNPKRARNFLLRAAGVADQDVLRQSLLEATRA